MTARTPRRQRLLDLLGPVISSHGYDLEDVTVAAAGRRSLIRVTVDGDNGIDLDAVATVSRSISDKLDGEDADFNGPYVLEISSPGVDRPLTEPRHWRRSVGRLVTVEVDEVAITGRVLSATEDSVELDIADDRRTYPLTALGIGRVQVEFARPGSATDSADLDEVEEEEA